LIICTKQEQQRLQLYRLWVSERCQMSSKAAWQLTYCRWLLPGTVTCLPAGPQTSAGQL
jgi:hypothetical protein